MNLILWRHAEAVDLGVPVTPGSKRDLERVLTDKGVEQAQASALWLKKNVKRKMRVICSPALRALQTAKAYTDKPEIIDDLNPLADASHVLGAINWPQGNDVLVIGHQPWIGRVASLLLAGQEQDWSVKKSAIWWLSHRVRQQESQEKAQTVLRLVLPPDLISKS
jgi:phosphohistidine phosphatase